MVVRFLHRLRVNIVNVEFSIGKDTGASDCSGGWIVSLPFHKPK